MPNDWYKIENVAEVDSPALVVYPDRIAENIRRMIAITGSADRLRPHIKTHKMSAIVRMQIEWGFRKRGFRPLSTIRESPPNYPKPADKPIAASIFYSTWTSAWDAAVSSRARR